MFLIYDLIIIIYAVFYLPYLLITRRAYPGFGMRFGIIPESLSTQLKAKTNIWVHAVSVGEVMVLDGFLEELRQRYPQYQLLVTVTTKTGYALACQKFNGKALVMPSPIDLSFITRKFISFINPKMYIVVETEIWPNLFGQLNRNKIPMAVVNGRISDNSFGRYQAIRFVLKGILNQAQVWCMQSQGDAKKIMELGADPSRVVVTGNIKFDNVSAPLDTSSDGIIHEKDGPWWVAGSTHPGEEEIVLNVYEKLKQDNPRWRLVIAPRHIERAGQVKELVARRGFKDVVVIDTIGLLRSLYAKASLVFVGKSLCVGGGHNVIEPACYGKAIVVGPKVANFRDIVACFKDAEALVQVEDARSFEAAIRELGRDTFKREALGVAALKVIAANQGATRRSLEQLAAYL